MNNCSHTRKCQLCITDRRERGRLYRHFKYALGIQTVNEMQILCIEVNIYIYLYSRRYLFNYGNYGICDFATYQRRKIQDVPQ